MERFNRAFLQILSEIPASIDPIEVKQKIHKRVEEVPSEAGQSTFAPLQKLDNLGLRHQVVDSILNAVFSERGNTYSPNVNDESSFKSAIRDAMMAVKAKVPQFKVNNTTAGFLANRLWTLLKSSISFDSQHDQPVKINKQVVTQKIDNAMKEVAQEVKRDVFQTAVTPEEAPTSGGETMDYSRVLGGEHRATESAFESLKADLEPINRRLVKNGLQPIELKVVKEDFQASKKSGFKYKMITFKIEVPTLVLPGGWKFVAKVDHTESGNVIVGAPNNGHERDLHKLYGNSQPSYCDHCKTTRTRNSTYVIENEQGELKRIGKQCLGLYIKGGENAVRRMVDLADYLSQLALEILELEQREWGDGEESSGGGGGGIPKYEDVQYALGMGFYIVKHNGYVSRTKAQADAYQGNTTSSTSDLVNMALYSREDDGARKAYSDKREEYDKMVQELLDWAPEYIEEQLKNGPSSYYSNLKVIVKRAIEHKIVEGKHLGFLLSLIPAFQRAQEDKVAPKEKKESDYVGTEGYYIGELTVNDLRKMKKAGVSTEGFPYNGPILTTIKSARGFEGSFGSSIILNLVDDYGNVYSMWGGSPDDKPGDKLLIKRARVKLHDSYTSKKTGKTVKQTALSHVAFGSPEEAEKFGSFKEHFENNL